MVKKILIVDDSRISRSIIKKCIPDDAGYELYEAVDGQDGLEKFREIKPDIMLLDLTMPVMDGRECLTKLKKEFPDAIVIVCTADIQKDSIEEVMSLGALDIIKKPPKKETVQDALLKADIALKNLS